MTAGICILNASGVALAADSAATLDTGNGFIITNTANKVFSLSRKYPIGAVIYDSADVMGVPAQLLLKEFRNEIDKHEEKSTVKEYVADFLKFLADNGSRFQFEIAEERIVCKALKILCEQIFECVINQINEYIEVNSENPTIEKLIEFRILAAKDILKQIKKEPGWENSVTQEYFKRKYSVLVWERTEQHLDNPEDALVKIILRAMMVWFTKSTFPLLATGIVFAGYGQSQTYPAMEHTVLSGVIGGKPQLWIRESVQATADTSGHIELLAQGDVMRTFMFGINEQVENSVQVIVGKALELYVDNVPDGLISEDQKQLLKQEFKSAPDLIRGVVHGMADREFYQPIESAIRHLGLADMASFAESMIDITSFKRKVALDSNNGTVGGPVDVAVISRGEGLIWVKRKYYFDRAINPQYAYNCYQERG